MGAIYLLANPRQENIEKINELIKDIERNGAAKGIGKPEPLKYPPGWSRRIDEGNRLLYDMGTSKN